MSPERERRRRKRREMKLRHHSLKEEEKDIFGKRETVWNFPHAERKREMGRRKGDVRNWLLRGVKRETGKRRCERERRRGHVWERRGSNSTRGNHSSLFRSASGALKFLYCCLIYCSFDDVEYSLSLALKLASYTSTKGILVFNFFYPHAHKTILDIR